MKRDVILVTGSREWIELPTMQAWLRPALSNGLTLVHGGARGADSMADSIARGMGVAIEARPVTERDGE